MSARATLNRLEPEIIVLGRAIQDVQSGLIDSDARAKEADETQEQLEYRVTLLEDLMKSDARAKEGVEGEERLEYRVTLIEDKVELLHKHLNAAFDRINDIHKWVDTLTDKDLRCHEEMVLSDEEFDFSDYSDKIDEEIVRVEHDRVHQMAEHYRELSDNPE